MENNINEVDNSPLNLTNSESKALRIKLKSIISKKINPKIVNLEKENSVVLNDWEELLDKLINSEAMIEDEVLESIASLVLFHEVVSDHLDKILVQTKKI